LKKKKWGKKKSSHLDSDFGLVAFQKIILKSCRHLMLNPSWDDAIANNDSTSEKLRRKIK
jgi:hypothetical protein